MSTEPINLHAAAELLGVHYQTAYKWVRSGELRATMVMGAYRLDSDTVARFAERRARPSQPRPRRPKTDAPGLSARMFEHLLAGDERQAAALLGGLLERGVPLTTAAQDVIVPALRQIGDEWRAGRLDVAVEHRASGIIERMLGDRYPAPRGRRRGTAVVAALAGDRHTLPTTLAAVALREDNWVVHHLGADLPAQELIGFCRQEPVQLAVLTVTATAVRADAVRAAHQLESLGLRTLVGDPGRSLTELQSLARGRHQPDARPPAPANPTR